MKIRSVRLSKWQLLLVGIVVLFAGCNNQKIDTPMWPKDMNVKMKKRAMLTNPDYTCFIPDSYDENFVGSHNEHFLVFDGPDGSLMSVWTQSLKAMNGKWNHVVFSKSNDEGITWAAPKLLVGPKNAEDTTKIAGWAFPMVSKSGRIYIVYNRSIGLTGWITFHTGIMEGIYSDDLGETWSTPQKIDMPKSRYDDPEGRIPPEWIVWQAPMRDLMGGYFVGYSHWINKAAAGLKGEIDWPQIESVVEFMRFTNIDQNPEPKNLDVVYSGWGDKALRVPHRQFPELTVAQEPSIVRLPDDRLFCVMRTNSGYIWWSQSIDDGQNWTTPRPLLYKDFGKPLLNPVACDPMYPLSDGRYAIFYYNNKGGEEAGGVNLANPREPLFISLGEYRPNAEQPVWFSPPKQFMATEGIGIDGIKRPIIDMNSGSLSLYSSFSNRKGVDVLWYPDTKCFLLGKKIASEYLKDMVVPR